MGRVTCMAFLGLKPEGKYCFVHRGGLALLCSDRPTSDLRNFSFKICVNYFLLRIFSSFSVG
jgi:hypothetical protein